MDSKTHTFLFEYHLKDASQNFKSLVETSVIAPLEKTLKSKFEVNYGKVTRSAYLEVADPVTAFGTVALSPEGLVTLQIEGQSEELQNAAVKFDFTDFEELILESLKPTLDEKCEMSNSFPPLRRGIKTFPYLRSSDNRVAEYKWEKVLFDDKSDYQHVQIVDTIDFGPLLILDGFANLAESDTVEYTHSLMNLPNENYAGKEVLILGGGDGGLIKEMFEFPGAGGKPAFVTMVDIDAMVMDACDKFMPNAAGDWLKRENWEGPNHKIIAGDAIKYMEDCIQSGKRFDYIFGDLTDTPVTTRPRDASLWKFLKGILTLGLQLVKPNTGKYLTHCIGKNAGSAIKEYETVLSQLLDGKCSFTRTQKFVTSFNETWLFYQISRNE